MKTPVILHPGKFSQKELDAPSKNPVWRKVDIYDSQIQELAEIRFPGDKRQQEEFVKGQSEGELAGSWVYYPWSGELVHIVSNEELFEIRTNRNKNLITAEEQNKLADSIVAVAGMSVGSGIALGCVYSGMSRTIKIADFDVLSTANLNRLRESITNIGISKVELTARNIYQVNPFADIKTFDKGLDASNIDKFFDDPKTSVVIDEIDDFKMKVRLRVEAKKHRTPLLMFTSLGDSILIDVERYDMDDSLEIFNGLIGNVADEILSKDTISVDDMKKYSVQLVGKEYVPLRAIESLGEIGKTLVGRPQLYSTVAVDSGIATYAIKQIILGHKLDSGRYFVRFSDLIGCS